MMRHRSLRKYIQVSLALVLGLALAAPAAAQGQSAAGSPAPGQAGGTLASSAPSPMSAPTAAGALAAPTQRPASTHADGVAPLLGEDSPDVIEGSYIVALEPDAAASDVAAAEEAAVARGGEVHHTYDAALRGFSAALPDEALDALRRHPGVAYIEADAEVQAEWATQTPAPWHLDRIDQRDLPLDDRYVYQATGDGVTAYIIDTGIHFSHDQFGGRAVHGFTSINDGLGSADCNGHGTHVAGIVGGEEYGVAKDVGLVSVRVLSCHGSGSLAGVIAGVDWVTANHSSPAAANMSLGGLASQALDDAVAASVASGVTYAVAAGGSNDDACNYSPARVSTALTVAASNASDQAAPFNNWGPCVDIFAPGQNITSAWHTSDSATNTLSGTSMAAPHVAGVATLHLEDNPSDSPADVGDAILSTATQGVLSGVGPGSPNLLVFSRLHTGPCEYDSRYHGSLPPPGSSVFEPGGTSYFAGAGWHHGCVIAPAWADVELSLLRWTGSSWQTIAASSGPGSVQDVSVEAAAGYFVWEITVNSGWGRYTFTMSRP